MPPNASELPDQESRHFSDKIASYVSKRVVRSRSNYFAGLLLFGETLAYIRGLLFEIHSGFSDPVAYEL